MPKTSLPVVLLSLFLAACGDEEGNGEASGETAQPTASAGEALYARHCLTCHQADGRGVPYFQPPLVGGEWVKGDPVTLAAYVITGGFDSASRTEGPNENVMPAFDYLSNEELADLLTYVRARFGGDAGTVTPDQVAQARDMAGS